MSVVFFSLWEQADHPPLSKRVYILILLEKPLGLKEFLLKRYIYFFLSIILPFKYIHALKLDYIASFFYFLHLYASNTSMYFRRNNHAIFQYLSAFSITQIRETCLSKLRSKVDVHAPDVLIL